MDGGRGRKKEWKIEVHVCVCVCVCVEGVEGVYVYTCVFVSATTDPKYNVLSLLSTN